MAFSLLCIFFTIFSANALVAQDSLSVAITDSASVVNSKEEGVSHTAKIFIVGNSFISNAEQISHTEIVVLDNKISPRKKTIANPLVAYNNEINKKIKKIVASQKSNLIKVANGKDTAVIKTADEQISFSLTRQITNDFKNTNKHIQLIDLIPNYINQHFFSLPESKIYQVLFDIDFVRPPPFVYNC